MRAIIYTTKTAALAAIEQCTAQITQGDIEFIGAGPHVQPEAKPYTTWIKHPTQSSKWAVIADDKVELCLGKTAVDLTEDWFKNDIS